MSLQYAEFFQAVTGYRPYPYQSELAHGGWPKVLDGPTGLGKTAAVAVAWLWRRLMNDAATGRRLIYCLPMRVLVKQVFADAEAWCRLARPAFEQRGKASPTVHLLMGGDVDTSWDTHPESDVVLVGTQDMLLSRALNRGYAMSRYRWPLHFGLLNSDCFWVFDETQIMGVAVETSAQLQGLRAALGTHGPVHSLWMSATLGEQQLDTVDHRRPDAGWQPHTLSEADYRQDSVKQRVQARKRIARLEQAALSKATQKGHASALADAVKAAHQKRGGLTLVVLNRVARAQELYRALQRDGVPDESLALVHSRFRAPDRARQEQFLARDRTDARIVVATQAVEAGVDVSARTLFTELAPWPSLVQRMGRCNRHGELADAAVHWIDVESDGKDDLALPYDLAALDHARALLGQLDSMGGDAGPATLRQLAYEPPRVVRPVVRRRDVLDLFDTTPDLCGSDVDVSRYVRDSDDVDCQVFWRELDGSPSKALTEARSEELCRVSLVAAKEFLEKLRKKREQADTALKSRLRAWAWDGLANEWASADRARPGQILLLDVVAGGYDPTLGWTGEVMPRTAVPEIAAQPHVRQRTAEAMTGDPDTAMSQWVALTKHLGHVELEAGRLAEGLGLDGWREALAVAGRWHDVGKAHDAFQQKLLAPGKTDPTYAPPSDGLWAKSNHNQHADSTRPYFRHELASALAWLQTAEAQGRSDDPDARRHVDLVAYLVAAHHGKVRVSIRSLPGEAPPTDPRCLYARGVWHGDQLPAVSLPTGEIVGPLELDLSCMQLGPESWLERILALRDNQSIGPFRLALLESMVRIADWRASAKEERREYGD
jgi:CRISPR-associated endonuclease/helicase Cas3